MSETGVRRRGRRAGRAAPARGRALVREGLWGTAATRGALSRRPPGVRFGPLACASARRGIWGRVSCQAAFSLTPRLASSRGRALTPRPLGSLAGWQSLGSEFTAPVTRALLETVRGCLEGAGAEQWEPLEPFEFCAVSVFYP